MGWRHPRRLSGLGGKAWQGSKPPMSSRRLPTPVPDASIGACVCHVNTLPGAGQTLAAEAHREREPRRQALVRSYEGGMREA
jgi:hypothetical protein